MSTDYRKMRDMQEFKNILAVKAVAIVSLVDDIWRFCGRCCGIFQGIQAFLKHGGPWGCSQYPSYHTCRNREECERNLDYFWLEHPDGRFIPA